MPFISQTQLYDKFSLPKKTLESGVNFQASEAPSDVNIMVDGGTYPRWKTSCFEKQKLFLKLWKTQQASIRDQWRHLQLMEPHCCYDTPKTFSYQGKIAWFKSIVWIAIRIATKIKPLSCCLGQKEAWNVCLREKIKAVGAYGRESWIIGPSLSQVFFYSLIFAVTHKKF